MITKVRFIRDQSGYPTLKLWVSYQNGVKSETSVLLTEAAYEEWVPDTNSFGYKGENLKDGIRWEKPIIPNLKAK